MTDKVREARLRRKAARNGLRLVKSRRRDPAAIDYGLYALLDVDTGFVVHISGVISIFRLTLDDVESFLS